MIPVERYFFNLKDEVGINPQVLVVFQWSGSVLPRFLGMYRTFARINLHSIMTSTSTLEDVQGVLLEELKAGIMRLVLAATPGN